MQAKVCLRLHIDMKGGTYMFYQDVCYFALKLSYFLFLVSKNEGFRSLAGT
jgi:hypothetical protein